MSNLKEIAQVSYDQVYPNASIQTSIKVEHFIVAAKARYAWELFRISKEERRSEGEWEIPSTLWRESDIEVKDDKADISLLNIFRSFEGDVWIGNIGGINCECNYLKKSVNLAQILCDDEYNGNARPYYVVGKSIKFPAGVHSPTLPMIYASDGTDLDDDIEIDDMIGDLIGNYLVQRFSNRMPEDRTANSNSNN